MEEKIVAVVNEMAEVLNVAQLKKLQEVLLKNFNENTKVEQPITNTEYLRLFIDAKSIEGCSARTIKYYSSTIEHMLSKIQTPIRKITTEIMREYLVDYQKQRNCSKTTVDNIRRNISSFFSWLEEEDYILKSPMRRIHKIKTKSVVKEVISDEEVEKLRDNCSTLRDLAIIDLFASSGMRIGELISLNIKDVNFDQREMIVYGKGGKERLCYFNARTKIEILDYLSTRHDKNPALFVQRKYPYERFQRGGIRHMLNDIENRTGIVNIHPHRFRRTLATSLLEKGMSLEQVKVILGHKRIETTLVYAGINQTDTKMNHQRYT